MTAYAFDCSAHSVQRPHGPALFTGANAMQCNRCTGRGYVVTGNKPRGGFASRTCRRCGGSGQCAPDQRNPIYWTAARLRAADPSTR